MRFAFILGTGRCGSSVLQELLSRHPDIGFVSNLDDRFSPLRLDRWNNPIYRRVPTGLTRKGRFRYAPSEGYRALEREVSPILSVSARDLTAQDATPWLSGRFRRFFEKRAHSQRRRVFLHKFTGWPRAGFIDRVFPEAVFVNVVRDGRAVANSLLQMAWWRGYGGPEEWGWGPLPEAYAREWEESGRSFVVLAGLQWKLLMDAYQLARSFIPDRRWVDLRYEDLVARPRDRLEEVLAFLGLSWDRRFEAGFGKHHLSQGPSDRYRRDLSDEDVRRLTASLEVHLSRWGYSS